MNINLWNTSIGKVCFTWMGHKPVLQVSEPFMIREIYANFHQFQKPRGGNPLSKLLVKGLIDTDADQWIKHRKIINPAFHVDKLKVKFLARSFTFPLTS